MINLIKKSLLAGAGAAAVTKEKIEEALEEFVRQGKLTAADAKVMAEKISDQGRREFDEVCTTVGAKVREFTARADEKTQARLAALELRVRALEEKLTPPSTRAGEP